MRLAYFIKRMDACYYVRAQVPMSHLSLMGHETREVLIERGVHCHYCKHREVQEYQITHPDDVYRCKNCFTPLRNGVFAWAKEVREALDWCDVAVFQRNTDISHLNLMRDAKSKGKFVVVESDDDYLNIPQTNNGFGYYKERESIIKEMFRVADGLTVTTENLKNVYYEFNKNIQVVPNAFDVDVFDVTPAFIDPYVYTGKNERITFDQFNKAREGKKFICWAGSATHHKDLEVVIEPLARLIKKENVIVGMCAFVHRQMMQLFPHDRLFLFGLVPVSNWYSMLQTIKPDVWIAPVEHNKFNASKSNIKSIEGAMMGANMVMSDFDTYNKDDFSLYLAENNSNSWFSCLRQAVNESEQSKAEGAAYNREVLLRDFDIKSTVKKWDKFFTTGKAE